MAIRGLINPNFTPCLTFQNCLASRKAYLQVLSLSFNISPSFGSMIFPIFLSFFQSRTTAAPSSSHYDSSPADDDEDDDPATYVIGGAPQRGFAPGSPAKTTSFDRGAGERSPVKSGFKTTFNLNGESSEQDSLESAPARREPTINSRTSPRKTAKKVFLPPMYATVSQ